MKKPNLEHSLFFSRSPAFKVGCQVDNLSRSLPEKYALAAVPGVASHIGKVSAQVESNLEEALQSNKAVESLLFRLLAGQRKETGGVGRDNQEEFTSSTIHSKEEA